MKVAGTFAATLTAWLVLTASPAPAQGVGANLQIEPIARQRLGNQSIYMAKMLCGTIPAKAGAPQLPAGALLAPGTYLSRINIHFLGQPREPQNFDIYLTSNTLLQSFTRPVQPFGATFLDCGTVIPDFDPAGPFTERSIAIIAVLKGGTVANVVGVYTFKNVEPEGTGGTVP